MSGRDASGSSTAQALAEACAERMYADDRASQGLGMRIDEVSPGRAVLSMRVREDMVNGHDICHGGFIFTLADSAFAFACNSFNRVTVAQGASIDFLRPATRGDRLRAEAKVVNQGSRTGVYDVEVRREDGKLIACFRGNSFSSDTALVGAGEERGK
jgi:acyl-CoA thioesterase